ncbi:hypothetical protein [Aquimonas voraii]|uniref:Uncharacterized protein n=1 Tax=Aquimonas voraii TaxID=265719 RepID=A0A1G6S851_9GAMM|nr:hypothetical protein [Aquimonas voraii]SDD12834.1 hypothetical protein SAMN04488509_101356 [Aquimonas voraii]
MTSIPRSLACLALLLPALASAQLPPGISGAWYNPEQSGHGLSVQILEDQRALAFWYVYDAEGNPVHLYLDGRIEGRRIEATAYAPRGMRFGSFRDTDLRMPVWGEVALDFSSCDRGLLQWDSDQPGYGSGSSEIHRLTHIAGLDCELGDAAQSAFALFTGIEQSAASGVRPTAYAALDENQTLWMLTPLATRADAVPGRSFVGDPGAVTRARIKQDSGLEFSRYASDWIFGRANALQPMRAEGSFDTEGGSLSFSFDAGRGSSLSLSPSTQQAVAPLTTGLLAGRWPVPMRGQFFDTVGELDIGGEGELCLRVGLFELEAGCRLQGRLRVASANPGFVEFELEDLEFPAQAAYRGRGWVQREGGLQRLVLVGDNGATGFGLIGRR